MPTKEIKDYVDGIRQLSNHTPIVQICLPPHKLRTRQVDERECGARRFDDLDMDWGLGDEEAAAALAIRLAKGFRETGDLVPNFVERDPLRFLVAQIKLGV